VDFYGGALKVLGKGNKIRSVPFVNETGKILRAYVRQEIGRDFEEIDPDTPLFLAERGGGAGKPLSSDGLRLLIYRLADMAGINRNVTKCSPHVMRHTFAYLSLMGNASEKALKEMLGHTTLHMTHNYINLAESDVKRNHQQFSPVEYLKRNKSKR
jgi:integrase/recombinase XerD